MFCLRSLISLQSLEIGNFCFRLVKTFIIDGFNSLITITIHSASFNQHNLTRMASVSTVDWQKANDLTKSLHITNCELLKSITIGDGSFGDFGGQFELKNLPSLSIIKIGEIGEKAYYWFTGFCHSSFVIRGIELILNI